MLVLQKSEYKTSDYINVIDSLRYFLGEIRVLVLWKDHRAMSDNPSLLISVLLKQNTWRQNCKCQYLEENYDNGGNLWK